MWLYAGQTEPRVIYRAFMEFQITVRLDCKKCAAVAAVLQLRQETMGVKRKKKNQAAFLDTH